MNDTTTCQMGPSLVDLCDTRIRLCLEESGLNTTILDKYFSFAQNDLYYNIGDQIKLHINDRITPAHAETQPQLAKIIEFVGENFRGPDETSESAIERFLAWYYRPGGEEYQRIKLYIEKYLR